MKLRSSESGGSAVRLIPVRLALQSLIALTAFAPFRANIGKAFQARILRHSCLEQARIGFFAYAFLGGGEISFGFFGFAELFVNQAAMVIQHGDVSC